LTGYKLVSFSRRTVLYGMRKLVRFKHNQTKIIEMGGECSVYGGEERYVQVFGGDT
jgi:hypothetical protein